MYCGINKLHFVHRGPCLSAPPLSSALSVRPISTSERRLAGVDPREEAIYTDEHWEMRLALRKLIEKEINPYVNEWEAAKAFPAHEVRDVVVCGNLIAR